MDFQRVAFHAKVRLWWLNTHCCRDKWYYSHCAGHTDITVMTMQTKTDMMLFGVHSKQGQQQRIVLLKQQARATEIHIVYNVCHDTLGYD